RSAPRPGPSSTSGAAPTSCIARGSTGRGRRWTIGSRRRKDEKRRLGVQDLLAARSQMAMSLAFHIIFAMVGIGMPLLMVLAEWRHLRTGEPIYLDLAKRWAKGTAILFAVGAVSGTVLSLELGLLWPGFMKFAGA